MKHCYLSILMVILCIGWNSDANAQSMGQKSNPTKISNISIYPNPATDYFSIASGNKLIKSISISNIVGKKIARLEATEDLTFNIEGLKSGIYIIRVFDKEDKMLKALKLSKS